MRAIFIGDQSAKIDHLSFGMTGEITGRCLNMFDFQPDADPAAPAKKINGWLIEKSELYFPNA